MALAPGAEKCTPQQVFGFLQSYNSKVLVFGNSFTTPEQVEPQTLASLAATIAALAKNTAIENSQAFSRANAMFSSRLSIKRASILELASRWFLLNCKKIHTLSLFIKLCLSLLCL